MLGYIRGTTTTTGLTVEAHLDESIYCKGQKPSAEEIKGLSIQKRTFPERNGTGAVIGITCRYLDGEKKAWKGGKRGLFVPTGWREAGGPLLLVEGPSDTLAAVALNLAVIGRPSNTGGVEHLAELLRDFPSERRILVVAEYDANDKGEWPGRDGAVETATRLAKRLGRSVSRALPPNGSKDLPAGALALTTDPESADHWNALGVPLLDRV